MHRQVMVPFCQVELDDVDDDLERRDYDLEIEVEDKVTLLDTVLFCYDSLFIEHPQ